MAAGDEWPDGLYRAYVEVQERHASRFFAAKAAHRPKLSLQVLDRLPPRITAMRQLEEPAAVLHRYRELDMQLEPLERQLGSIDRGWEEYLEQETQRLRGN